MHRGGTGDLYKCVRKSIKENLSGIETLEILYGNLLRLASSPRERAEQCCAYRLWRYLAKRADGIMDCNIAERVAV